MAVIPGRLFARTGIQSSGTAIVKGWIPGSSLTRRP